MFDMHANTASLSGHVVVAQGQCVVRAERLVVDLNTGVSHFETAGGRVEALFPPGNCMGAGTERPPR
jgi:lipopolysaccharide export system protein LptA